MSAILEEKNPENQYAVRNETWRQAWDDILGGEPSVSLPDGISLSRPLAN